MFTGIAEHPKKARTETVQGLTVQTAEVEVILLRLSNSRVLVGTLVGTSQVS